MVKRFIGNNCFEGFKDKRIALFAENFLHGTNKISMKIAIKELFVSTQHLCTLPTHLFSDPII